eukprot:EG_transcript_26811
MPAAATTIGIRGFVTTVTKVPYRLGEGSLGVRLLRTGSHPCIHLVIAFCHYTLSLCSNRPSHPANGTDEAGSLQTFSGDPGFVFLHSPPCTLFLFSLPFHDLFPVLLCSDIPFHIFSYSASFFRIITVFL